VQAKKGMKAVEGKNIVKDIESKKLNWKDFGVPDWLFFNLTGMPLEYEKPSVIQAKSIPLIIGNRDQNFIFQYKYGSGKKGAIAVPAVMTVDPTIKDYQVIILCHTKELI
jgi:superfamily II DNA/RNA helicase